MSIWSFWTRRRTARLVATIAREVAERTTSRSSTEFAAAPAPCAWPKPAATSARCAWISCTASWPTCTPATSSPTPAIQTAIVSQATDAVVVGVLAELRSLPKGGAGRQSACRVAEFQTQAGTCQRRRGAVKWRARRKSDRIHLSIPDCGTCRGIIDRAIVARAGGRVGGVSNAGITPTS